MREFFKSFFLLGIATTIEKIIAFLLLPIYTRYFDISEYGVIDLIIVTISIVSIFAELQLETALQRYYYDYEGAEKRRLISTNFIVITSLSLLLTCLLFYFSEEVSLLVFDKVDYSPLVELAALQLPFINFTMLAFIILRYERRNKSFLILMLIKVGITLIFTLLFVVWFKLGIYGVFYAQLIGLISSTVLLFLSTKDFLVFEVSPFFLKKSFVYALPQFPARIGSALLSNANRFFMVSYLTIASVGLFSLSLKLASVIQLLYAAFIMAWAPFMFEQLKKDNHKEVFVKVLILTACPVFLMVSIISLFSKEIVLLIASSEFYEAYHYVGGLSLYFSLFIFKEIVDIGPKHTEKTKYLSLTFLLSLIVNISSLYLFIIWFGLKGVIYSMILTNIFLLLISWIISNRLYYIPHKIFLFIVVSAPAFLLALGSMFTIPPLFIRIVVLVGVCLFYGIIFLKYLKFFLKQTVAIKA
ncbi:MAG: lipopolysaccharide biosynthesis protein [Flavobacterium sp.]|nr:lipopolysaccharide biosynthesis protein [Flavobacterium sp.]